MKGWETAWDKLPAVSFLTASILLREKKYGWKAKPVGHGLLMFICLQFVKLQRTSKTFLSVFVCSTWFRFMTFSWMLNRTDFDAKSAAYKEGRYQWDQLQLMISCHHLLSEHLHCIDLILSLGLVPHKHHLNVSRLVMDMDNTSTPTQRNPLASKTALTVENMSAWWYSSIVLAFP